MSDLLESDMPACPALFAGQTGAGVRIAIIDSGVHAIHDHIDAGRIGPGVCVHKDGTVEGGSDAIIDRLGHGTAVTAAIQEKAPQALCLPVRVFQDSLRTSAAALLAAIRWSVEQKADIINLSLGSTNSAHASHYARAVSEAADAGCLIVAARMANESPCYPGALPGVAGVELDWDCPRTRYRSARLDGNPAFFASGYPRPIPGVAQRRNLHGISFATAQMSGFAALACQSLLDTPKDHARVAELLARLSAAGA